MMSRLLSTLFLIGMAAAQSTVLSTVCPTGYSYVSYIETDFKGDRCEECKTDKIYPHPTDPDKNIKRCIELKEGTPFECPKHCETYVDPTRDTKGKDGQPINITECVDIEARSGDRSKKRVPCRPSPASTYTDHACARGKYQWQQDGTVSCDGGDIPQKLCPSHCDNVVSEDGILESEGMVCTYKSEWGDEELKGKLKGVFPCRLHDESLCPVGDYETEADGRKVGDDLSGVNLTAPYRKLGDVCRIQGGNFYCPTNCEQVHDPWRIALYGTHCLMKGELARLERKKRKGGILRPHAVRCHVSEEDACVHLKSLGDYKYDKETKKCGIVNNGQFVSLKCPAHCPETKPGSEECFMMKNRFKGGTPTKVDCTLTGKYVRDYILRQHQEDN